MDFRHTLAAQQIRHTTTWEGVDAVASRARVPIHIVMSWWTQGQMFALTDAHGQPLFPTYAFQPADGRPYIVVGQIWRLFQQAHLGPWEVAAWMCLRQGSLGGRAPMELLAEGRACDLLVAAGHALLDHARPSGPVAPLHLP